MIKDKKWEDTYKEYNNDENVYGELDGLDAPIGDKNLKQEREKKIDQKVFNPTRSVYPGRPYQRATRPIGSTPYLPNIDNGDRMITGSYSQPQRAVGSEDKDKAVQGEQSADVDPYAGVEMVYVNEDGSESTMPVSDYLKSLKELKSNKQNVENTLSEIKEMRQMLKSLKSVTQQMP